MVCLPLPLLPHAASRPGTETTPAPTAAPRSTERRESWLGEGDCVITPPALFREWRVGLGDSNATIQNSPQSSGRDVGYQGPRSASFQVCDMNVSAAQRVARSERGGALRCPGRR